MTDMRMAILSVLIIVFLLLFVYFYLKGKRQLVEEDEIQNFDEALDALKVYMASLVAEPDDDGGTDAEYRKKKERRRKVQDELKKSSYGVPASVQFVKELIKEFVQEKIRQFRVDQMLGLDAGSIPNHHVMFEIIMYKYQQINQGYALSEWIFENRLNDPKPAMGICMPGSKAYYITPQELEDSYAKLDYRLSPEERVDILTLLLYEKFRGFGLLQTITEMKINGINIGVSGSVMNAVEQASENPDDGIEAVSVVTNSIWLYLGQQYIHLQFLDFGSTDEMRRVIQLMVRYNSPGPLTAKRGYLVNVMYNQDRILAMRPPVNECWAAFIRKNPISKIDPRSLIIKDYTHGGEIAVALLQYIISGMVITAVTGRQGSGKTTLMIGLVAYYDPAYNIRVLEMAPEMYLRERYPYRNIDSAQETVDVPAEDIQDAFKKSDSYITIVGEVATDPVAARMVQLAMTGSVSTMFSHHANTAKDLVLTLRNSLVNAGGFDNMQVAEKQVTDVVRLNVHMNYKGNKRYIERITEIIPLEEGADYPKYKPDEHNASMAAITTEYYRRTTDRISFTWKDILVYDTDSDTYVPMDDFSPQTREKILTNLDKEKGREFEKFMAYYWHNQSIDGYTGLGNEDITADTNEQFVGNEVDGLKDIDRAAEILSRRSFTPYGFTKEVPKDFVGLSDL